MAMTMDCCDSGKAIHTMVQTVDLLCDHELTVKLLYKELMELLVVTGYYTYQRTNPERFCVFTCEFSVAPSTGVSNSTSES